LKSGVSCRTAIRNVPVSSSALTFMIGRTSMDALSSPWIRTPVGAVRSVGIMLYKVALETWGGDGLGGDARCLHVGVCVARVRPTFCHVSSVDTMDTLPRTMSRPSVRGPGLGRLARLCFLPLEKVYDAARLCREQLGTECIGMKKALMTGITGQDGSYLAEHLLSKGYEVHGNDDP